MGGAFRVVEPFRPQPDPRTRARCRANESWIRYASEVSAAEWAVGSGSVRLRVSVA